jgi:hypothetical protein
MTSVFITIVVSQLFQTIAGSSGKDSSTFRIGIIAELLSNHPDLMSWYSCFGEPLQTELLIYKPVIQEIDYAYENPVCIDCNILSVI